MSRLSKATIGFNGLLATLNDVVSGWHPEVLKTELAYSNSLAAHLRAVLPEDSRIEREYRHEGTTCDLCVVYSGLLSADRVLIEVKKDLRRKANYDRLVGQVEGLKPRKNKILVVLVGQTDPALLGRFKEHFRDQLEGFGSVLGLVVMGHEDIAPES